MSNKVWMIGHKNDYREKFDLFIKSMFVPEEIKEYIKTPNFYKCYFKNGDYLYGSNFNINNTMGLRFDAIFIESYIYWNVFTEQDREQLFFAVRDSNDIFIV